MFNSIRVGVWLCYILHNSTTSHHKLHGNLWQPVSLCPRDISLKWKGKAHVMYAEVWVNHDGWWNWGSESVANCWQTHTLQQCNGYTKEAARGDDAARRFPLALFALSVELHCSLSSSIMIKVQEEKGSRGAPALQQSVKRPFGWESAQMPDTCFLVAGITGMYYGWMVFTQKQ